MERQLRMIIKESLKKAMGNVLLEGSEKFASNLNPQELEAAKKLFNRMKKMGGNSDVNLDFTSNDRREIIFNYAVERAIEEYEQTRDESLLSAIKAAYPPQSNKLQFIIGDKWMNNPEFDAAMTDAWSRTLGEDPLKQINAYRAGGGRGSFGATVVSSMRQDIMDYFRTKAGKASGDVSLDAPIGDDGGRTMGDIIGTMGDPSYEGPGYGEEVHSEFREASEEAYNWLLNNTKNPKLATVFKEVVMFRNPLPEVYENHSDIFASMKDVTDTANNLFKSTKLERMISKIYANYGMDIDFSNWKTNVFTKQEKIPTPSEPETAEFAGVYEGINKEKLLEALVERVFKRLK